MEIIQEVNNFFKGSYKFDLVNENNEVTYSSPVFDNLITNLGLSALGLNDDLSSTLYTCKVGTGSATPLFTDANLGHNSPTTSVSQYLDPSASYSYSGSYYVRNLTKDFAFGPYTLANANLNEVGVFDSSARLFSRALIPGAPLTIPAGSVLRVTYTLQQLVSTTPVTGSVNITNVGSLNFSSVFNNFSSRPRLRDNLYLIESSGFILPNTSASYTGSFIGIGTDSNGSVGYYNSYLTGSNGNQSVNSYFFNYNNSVTSGSGINGGTFFTTTNTSPYSQSYFAFKLNTPFTKSTNQTLVLTFTSNWDRAA